MYSCYRCYSIYRCVLCNKHCHILVHIAQICAGCVAMSKMSKSGFTYCVCLQDMRKRHKGSRGQVTARDPPMKTAADFKQAMDSLLVGGRPILLDLFAGTCVVGTAAEMHGWASLSMDILNGPDLTDKDMLDAIIAAINGGQVAAVMLAPPCNSWSSARRGKRNARTKDGKLSNKGWPRALRSPNAPWGLHGSVQFTPKDLTVQIIKIYANWLIKFDQVVFWIFWDFWVRFDCRLVCSPFMLIMDRYG